MGDIQYELGLWMVSLFFLLKKSFYLYMYCLGTIWCRAGHIDLKGCANNAICDGNREKNKRVQG